MTVLIYFEKQKEMSGDIGNSGKERTHAMKATVLLDNIGTEELTGDWGLSFYIEYAGKKILLDAGGESCLFAENAGSWA